MNKRGVFVICAILLTAAVALGAAYFSNSQSANEQNQAEIQRQAELPPSSPAPKTTETNDKTVAPQPGAYVAYSNTIIADTKGTKVLFFHAPWCPQCRAIESDIKAQPSLPSDTTIIKVDYDSNQKLRQKYGVTLQTTFVRVDDKGELVKKYVAYNEPTFAAVKANILD